jgi:predicted nucleic acid-binding protein
MASRTVFLDTSFIIALENRDDPYHQRAKQLARELDEQNVTLLLHWGVLLEIGDGYARLNRREKGRQVLHRLFNEQGYQVDLLDEPLLTDAVEMYQSRADKEWGLTDCVSFVLMRRKGIFEALTADVHFRQAGFNPLLADG